MDLRELHEDEDAVADHRAHVVHRGEQHLVALGALGRRDDGDDRRGQCAHHEPHEAEHALGAVEDLRRGGIGAAR